MASYTTVQIEGIEIFYREGGDPSGPALLLLPGFPTSSGQYEQLMQHLPDLRVISPDYPGFGRSQRLEGMTTFDRVAAVIDAFTSAVDLERFSLYMFDFGAPVGFRIATIHPDRIESLVIQNGNAYESGLGPGMQALLPYWKDRQAHESDVRGFLTLEATRSQYVDGVPLPETVNPDLWELDQRYIDLPGHDQVMLDLLFDYQNNLTLYPVWQRYLRDRQPRILLTWGVNDAFFPPAGAHAYLADLPGAELHLLDTGHFATATHSLQIAELITSFLSAGAGS